MVHTIEDDCTRAALLMVKLNHQRTQAQFCDCVIRKSQGKVYPVHRCILAASSPVLASMLNSSGVLVEMEAPYLSDCILGYLLDYIYTGNLPNLDYKLYLHMLAAAQYLEMDELQHTIRTKAAETLENYNRTNDNRCMLLPQRTDCCKKSTEAPLCFSSESENSQRDTLGTHLSLDAKNKCVHWCEPDNHMCGLFETYQTSFHIGMERLSPVCPDKQNNQSAGVLKPETWHEKNEEESKSHASVSKELQENEKSHVEKTQELLQHMVKAEEIQSLSEDKYHNSPFCSTSVIRHSSRVTGVDEENVAITERTYCAIAKEEKAPNSHFNKPELEYTPAYKHNICSVNLLKKNDLLDVIYFEKDDPNPNKNEQYVLENRCKEHSQMQDLHRISTKNTTFNSPVGNLAVALADEISDTRITFRNKGICGKRKLKEKNSDICKSAKTETKANADSSYNNEQDATLETTNTPTTTLYGNLSTPPEESTCQRTYTEIQPSYSGQLFYHCESRTSHIPFNPNFSPSLSDTSSEDNDVSLCSTLNQTTTLGKGEVVLLDISTKSSEMLVSYKCAPEMGTDEIKTDHDQSQNDDQGGNNRHILTSLITCKSGCAHNSTVSTSISDPSLSSCTNTSDFPSPVHHAFQCSLCERSFSQRGSLNRHVRSHLGVRPFPCPQCPMSFSRQYRVVEHMRIHQRSATGTDFPKPPASSV